MKVYKFGGASVNSAERVSNVADILERFPDEDLVIVISAMGKTTNALEKVVQAYYHHKKEEALQLFEEIKKQHTTIAKYLLVTHYLACEARLKDFFTEVEWMLHDQPVREFDYYYDQVVSIGELLSTCIVSAYLSVQTFLRLRRGELLCKFPLPALEQRMSNGPSTGTFSGICP